MYDICLISKVIELSEILAMEEKDAIALNNLMSESIGKEIMNFFKRYDELGIEKENNIIANMLKKKRAMLYDILYDKARKYTFHLEIAERNLLDFVKRISSNSILMMNSDREEAIENLEWFLANEKYCIASLDVRSKEDFNIFVERMLELEKTARHIHSVYGTPMCIDIEQSIECNKAYFYNPREQKQYKGMHIMLNSTNKIIEAINGLKYSLLCEKEGIYAYTRRKFF